MSEETAPESLQLNQSTMDVLIANIIPTTKYFESRFDHLQYQVNEIKTGQQSMMSDINKRFVDMKSDMDKRFEQVDKRFVDMKSDMDKRFEQVDKRFEQVDQKLDKILERIDRRIDDGFREIRTVTDNGLRENRAASMRMFTFALMFSAISMVGLIGRFLKLY